MRLRYCLKPHWPTLAWLAQCSPGRDAVVVEHGSGVETGPDGFCEATWNGAFEAMDFDRADAFFGSGARLRDDRLTFVSSISTSDRLYDTQSGDTWLVSNSLPCLVRARGDALDPWYPWYYEDLHSIGEGIDDYLDVMQLAGGEARITYWRNLCWDGRELERREKALQNPTFDDFDGYRAMLGSTLSRIADNMASPARRHPLSPLCTASSGYDGLTATVLAREIGAREVVCVVEDRLGKSDSAVSLVERLGMTPLVLSRFQWRDEALNPAPFIAGDVSAREAWIAILGERLSRRVLFTGNRGDLAWSLTPPPAQRVATNRQLGSACMSWTEYRLRAGFLHCPVPTIGLDGLDQLRGISRSEDMAPWRIGGPYDRPIPRRIVESAGIPRDAFGRRKTAASIHLFNRREFDRFLAGTPAFHDYMRWLRRVSRTSPHNGTYPKRRTPGREQIDVPLFRHLFPWAVEQCMKAYDDTDDAPVQG